MRNFLVTLRYDDGREDVFTAARPDRVAEVDKLFVELSPDFTGALTGVELRSLDARPLSGEVMVCGDGKAPGTASADERTIQQRRT